MVDDGSTDGTGELLGKEEVEVISNSYNKGYGAALKAGIRHVKHAMVIIMLGVVFRVPLLDTIRQSYMPMKVFKRIGVCKRSLSIGELIDPESVTLLKITSILLILIPMRTVQPIS